MAAPIRDTSSDFAMDGDYEWHCPTDAELKIIQARRERSDQISKIMGDYLLKGYTMLGSTCDVCQTILLRNKAGKNYCISCSELDSDADKDNPVVNQDAALSQAREAELANKSSKESSTRENIPSSRSPRNLSMDTVKVVGINPCTRKPEFPSTSDDTARIVTISGLDQEEGQPFPLADHVHRQVGEVSSEMQTDITKTLRVLYSKIHWATEELKTTASIEYGLQLCQMIKLSADAIQSVKKTEQC